MNSSASYKPNGAQQKQAIIAAITESVTLHAGCESGDDLSLELGSVAAAVYHYTLGVYGSAEIAARIKMDPAFAAWRKMGTPSATDISTARTAQAPLLRRCLVEVLGWSWNVSLRSQVTGESTLSYTERVIAGRQQEFKSKAKVEAEADSRIAAAAQADVA